MLHRPATHLKTRIGAIAVLATLAGLRGWWIERPEDESVEAIEALIERATDTEVSDMSWEPSRGLIIDALFGRPALYLARRDGDAPEEHHDVARAFLRVAPEGKVLALRRTRNLTETEQADERGLLVRGPFAAFASSAFGRVQTVTALDLRGDDLGHHSLLGAAQLAVDHFLRTGDLAGLGRVDFDFEAPPAEVSLELDERGLMVATVAGSERIDLARELHEALPGALASTVDEDDDGAISLTAIPRGAEPKPLLHWFADTGRTFIGVGAIAWLEGRALSALDRVHRWGYQLQTAPEEASPAPVTPRTLDAKGPTTEESWPPAPLPSFWKDLREGEGVWKPAVPSFLPTVSEKATDEEPYFMSTFVRPDRERPYAEVRFVAMDMRRLELGMEGGYEDPAPTTGRPGTGHVPAEPARYKKIVATFNGAFKSTHGKHGMAVEGRVLVPPLPGAATVRVDDDGRIGMGTWPETIVPRDEARIVSFRQNLEPLIADGVPNPTGRRVWGEHLYGQGVATERSAICVTRAGHLLYAWAAEASGTTLAEALRLADCDYGMHLDMNPGHCAFVFTRIHDFETMNVETQLLSPEMRVNERRFVRWSPQDFFYVSLRQGTRQRGDQEVVWTPDPGRQPAPRLSPGIVRGEVELGTLSVRLTSFQPGRFAYRALPGTREPLDSKLPEDAFTLNPSDEGSVLAAIGIGHGTNAQRLGLRLDDTDVIALQRTEASLILGADGSIRLLDRGVFVPQTAGEQVLQLPILARRGKLTETARNLGAKAERGAMCVSDSGALLIARVDHDTTAPAARALLDLGCELVVALDRGSHHPPFVERAGTERPPRAGHEVTTLYALARPMRPNAYVWRPEADAD